MKSCALATLLAAAVASGQSAQRFRSGVDLVTVDALVTDGRRPIAGLTAADFELRDEGVLQSIEQVHLETLPVNVIFVLDISQSVAGRRLDNLKIAAISIIDKLVAADRVALLTFSHQLTRHTGLTPDHERVKQMVRGLRASGSTALRDAATTGLTLRGTDRGRALLVLFSDGMDTSSFLPAERVIEAASRSDLVVYGVGFRPPAPIPDGSSLKRWPVPDLYGDDAFLRSLAKATGGRVETADGDDDIAKAFDRVLIEFRARYVLGFTPAGVRAGGWHRIDVRLKSRKGVVTARRGYFAR